MYRVLSAGGDFHEVCDECGFHGGTLDLAGTVARIRSLPERWADVMSQDEALLRARPEPETWCVVEYAQHVLSAIGAIEWAARVFASGAVLNWDECPDDELAGVEEHPVHECGRFDIAETLTQLGVAARSMADFAESLTAEEQSRVTTYADSWVLNTTAVIRHALHDAEHHLLDVRRGTARQKLRS